MVEYYLLGIDDVKMTILTNFTLYTSTRQLKRSLFTQFRPGGLHAGTETYPKIIIQKLIENWMYKKERVP